MALGRHVCVDCKVESPETDLRYSLISLAGWRATKVEEPGKEAVDQWRCPNCWARHKRKWLTQTQQHLPTLDALRDPSKRRS